MFSLATEQNLARLIFTIAPLRVYGNGSRGTEDEQEHLMETSYEHGIAQAFDTMSEIGMFNELNHWTVYGDVLTEFESELRANGNRLSLIDRPATIHQAAQAVNHQIPGENIKTFAEILTHMVPKAVAQAHEMLHNTDAFKANITLAHNAREFGYNMYIAAALAALGMISPAWDAELGTETDKFLFYKMVKESSDFDHEVNLSVLLTPPNAASADEVRYIAADMKMSALHIERTLEDQSMHRGEYGALWAEAWLAALK